MLRLVSLAVGVLLIATGCAANECRFHSECGSGRYCGGGFCRQDCRADFDCAEGQACSEIGRCGEPFDAGPTVDAGPVNDAGPVEDGGPTPMVDGGPMPEVDSGPTPMVDGGPPPVDGGPPPVDGGPVAGSGRYLDRCTVDGDCMSLRCVDDVGGSRMCTRPCTGHGECAARHVCSGGVCRYDDTGIGCNLLTPETCQLDACIGREDLGTGHCTRPCANASVCPAGFACTEVEGQHICVDIERPCAECATGSCLSEGRGCTSTCRTAADCPRRTPDAAPYTCAPGPGGQTFCIPPMDVLGPDPIGTACPDVGLSTCRSGACFSGYPTGSMCTQACTETGGCGPSFGCFPFEMSGTVNLVCARAGTSPIGAACSTGRTCDSGLCQPPGYCTRLCTTDGLCPSDMSCTPTGLGISLCLR